MPDLGFLQVVLLVGASIIAIVVYGIIGVITYSFINYDGLGGELIAPIAGIFWFVTIPVLFLTWLWNLLFIKTGIYQKIESIGSNLGKRYYDWKNG